MNAGFERSNFRLADLSQVAAFNADFLAANMTNALARNGDFRNARFQSTTLTCSIFDNALLGGVTP